jgi:hypothetical protein
MRVDGKLAGAAAAALLLLVSAATLRADQEPDPAARLLAGKRASEQWDLVAQLDGGYLVFARFLISNAGPGERNAVAVGHVVTPDGSSHEFQNGRKQKRWTLSEDRLFMDVGRSHLDLHSPAHRLDIHKKDLIIDLRFSPKGGQSAPAGLLPEGYHLDWVGSDLQAEGSLWLEGMSEPLAVRGRVAETHSWAESEESDLALRRIELFSFEGENTLYLADFLTPKGKGSRWLLRMEGPDRVLSTSDFSSELDENGLTLERGRYWVPRSMHLQGPQVDGEISLRKVVLEYDPLKSLPQPFRFLVSLRMGPHRVWADARFEVTLRPSPDRPPLHDSGSGVAVVTFLNPVSKP